MAFSSPRKEITAKVKRPLDLEVTFYTDVLQSQQTDTKGDLADTLLICAGGTIRTHAFLLQAASPFIQNAFQSQGENYPFQREILLPDFSVKEIEKMITLIYKGSVDLKNTKEIQNLRDTLKFFQITNFLVKNEKKGNAIKGALKIHELNRIPNDIFKQESKEKLSQSNAYVEIVSVPNSSWKEEKKIKMSPSCRNEREGKIERVGNSAVRRCGRTPRKSDSDDDSADFEMIHGAEAISDNLPHPVKPLLQNNNKTEKGTTIKSRQPVLKLPRVVLPKHLTTSTHTSTSTTTTPAATSEKAKPNDKEDSETDDEDIDWIEPAYKDKEWFRRESSLCQFCNKKFAKPAESSICITSHKILRCYFCFKIYSSTDILFKHFRRHHKQAGRENSLICPFCELTIPYKTVSCHVISTHLRIKQEDESSSSTMKASSSSSVASNSSIKSGTNGGKTRSKSPSSTDLAAAKKPKGSNQDDGEKFKQLTLTDMKKSKDNASAVRKYDILLKVPDFDVYLEKETVIGTKLCFRLQKARPK